MYARYACIRKRSYLPYMHVLFLFFFLLFLFYKKRKKREKREEKKVRIVGNLSRHLPTYYFLERRKERERAREIFPPDYRYLQYIPKYLK